MIPLIGIPPFAKQSTTLTNAMKKMKARNESTRPQLDAIMNLDGKNKVGSGMKVVVATRSYLALCERIQTSC